MEVVCFDLDDTLYKEIDYLKSAYREIAACAIRRYDDCQLSIQASEVDVYEVMLEAYKNGNNAFEALNAYLGVELPKSDLLKMYREHVPNISLTDDVRCTLDRLKAKGVIMGILSDGREQTQWNKIKALGLTQWMDESCIIINSSQECFKPNSDGYHRFEKAVRALTSETDLTFTYIGDNLKKDFIYPKQKGWKTICLKDDGRNIHRQDFISTISEALPDVVIGSFKDILIRNLVI